MSLGLNPIQRRRTTNLPGTVSSFPIRRSPPRKSSPPVPPPVPPSVPPPSSRVKEELPHEVLHQEMQWVYGTCMVDDVPDMRFNERVLLVYPMHTEGERVSMRLKRAHPVTGKLSYTWVCVYDGDAVEVTHRVGDFSLVA